MPIVQADTKFFADTNQARDVIVTMLDEVIAQTEKMANLSEQLMQQLRPRVHMHSISLGVVLYAVHHDFVRGWVYMDERTFMHVTTGFWQMTMMFR